MNPYPLRGMQDEIATLITTLHETGQRLELLTAGEVDSVSDDKGRAFLLQSAQEGLRHIEATKQAAVLNVLPAHIALLNAQGIIISVNEAWRHFGDANALQGPGYGVGVDYLAICDQARGEDATEARQAAKGIRSVLAGTAKRYSLEYPCHAPTGKRWFLMTVTPLGGDHPNGAVVMHLNITDRKLNELEVIATRNQLQGTLDALPDLLFELGLDGLYYDYHSPRIDLLATPAANLIGRTVFEVLPADAANVILSALQEANKNGRSMGNQFELELPQGRMTFELSVSRKATAPGQEPRFICLSRDITDRKTAETRIIYLNRVYAMLSGINTLIIRVQDYDELFQEACRLAVETGGFSMSLIAIIDSATKTINPVASAGKDEELLSATKDLVSSHEIASTTMVARAVSEKTAIVSNDSQNDPRVLLGKKYAEAGVRSIAILPLIISDEVKGVLALYSGEIEFFHDDEMKLLTELAGDIAFAMDHINKQERINYLAYYDVLTGLANRRLFLERVSLYMRSAASDRHNMALFLVDLQRFKNINDSLGRQAGDMLLQRTAEWLKRHVGDINLLARVGADQFAIVMPEIRQNGDVTKLIEKMIDSFQAHPFKLDDTVLRITARIGVALYPDDGIDAETLFQNAEAALKKAKVRGDRYLFYTQDMTETVAGKLTLENQLRRALDNGEFVLHYQPKVNLASGQIAGAEALIRWNDPETGLVPPGKFIPILEETGMIHDVGRWALHQAIADYLRWHNAGMAVVRIAVNVSPLQLRHPDFVAEIRQAINIGTHAADGLELEITESLIMEEVKHNITTLQAIRVMGVSIAIDDFGTGFSSLSYLAKLPVDSLKIDRSFVVDMTLSSQGQALVSTIITLAHSLKLKVVAEGVETEEQSRLLRLLGCDEMQGYLFSKPLPVETFEARFLAPMVSTDV